MTIDLHNHVHMKPYMYGRDINNRGWLSRFMNKHRGFWPFSHRNTLTGIRDNLDVAVCTSFVPEQGWYEDVPTINWLSRLHRGFNKRIRKPSYFQATLGMMDYLEQEVRKIEDLSFDRTVAQLKESLSYSTPCIIHSVEGAHSLEDDELSPIECLDVLFDRGVAYLTLAHFYPNVCVENNVFPYPEEQGSHVKDYWKKRAVWDESGGLTETGREVVERMLEIGMIIDITHLTLEGRKQVYDIVDHHEKEACLIASHIGAFECHRLTYNLQDWELDWLGSRQCLAGVIFMNSWLSPTKPTGAGLANIERTIKHMINVGGEGLPAIGTDFDGFTDPPDELTRIEDIGVLRRHLSHCGYTDERINAIMGGNAKRVLLEGWKR